MSIACRLCGNCCQTSGCPGFAPVKQVGVPVLLACPKQRDAEGRPLAPAERDIERLIEDEDRIRELRQRLASISWLMKCLKEYISRKANAEDGCSGRFWEARFKSTALLDDAAVLACLVYIDLNPIRAKLAETPDTSKFTSAEERIRGYRAREAKKQLPNPEDRDRALRNRSDACCDQWLCPLANTPDRRGLLSIDLPRYLEILDWTGRQFVEGKPGAIPDHLPPILSRLSINPNHWLEGVGRFGALFSVAAGTETHMKEAAARMGQKWVCGIRAGKTIFME